MPRCTTNWDKDALRLYERRPCHKRRFLMCSNLSIEKSAASDACFPSLPTIPRPTSASMIIGTSLPPSPTQAMRFPVALMIHFATAAFYMGLQRQTQTEFAFLATLKNLSHKFKFASTTSRVVPVIISIWLSIRLLNSSRALMISYSTTRSFFSFTLIISKIDSFLDFKPVDIAMHLAVSILSPVSIQI